MRATGKPADGYLDVGSERVSDGRSELPPALAALLLQRVRLVLWLMFAAGIGFTALELAFAAKLGPHTVVKFFGLISMSIAIFLSRRPWGAAHIYPLAVLIVSGGYVLTALSGALSPSREYATSATLFVVAALTTATMLPWGAPAQFVSVLVGALSLGLSVLRAEGSLALADSDPAAAELLAFGASVAVAREMQRSRLDAIRQDQLRRGAESKVRALNASLEQRVSERTAELEQANTRLEAEIEERQRVAEALRESQQRLLDVVDNSTALISLKDTQGNYLLVNREFERVFGVARERAIGRTDDALLGADVAGAQRERDRQVIEGDGPYSFDDVLPDATSTRSYVTVKFPLHGPDGRPYGVGSISTDITRLRSAEEQARQQHEELAHVQRLHLVNQMAAVLAHEIHQPLGAIANYAQGGVHRLRGGRAQLGELLIVLEKIAAEALRAGGVLRSVRRLVSKQSPPLEPVDVNAAVAEAAQMLELQARRHGVDLHVATTPTRPFVIADKTQIEQVLVNLTLNGIDAAIAADGPRRVHVQTEVEEDSVAITVGDTGPGVAPEAQAKLFTPFFTTKPHGLGMGLAICRSIVEGHGGTLKLVANAGGGAVFRVALPLAAPLSESGAPALRSVSLKGERIGALRSVPRKRAPF